MKLTKNMEDRLTYEKRKKQEGVPYATSGFDQREKRLDRLMNIVSYRRRKDSQYKQEQEQGNTSIVENKTLEDQEWEFIKEKYYYDELEPEKQQIVEEQFREMIYKKRMHEIEGDDDLFDDGAMDREKTESIEHSRKRIM